MEPVWTSVAVSAAWPAQPAQRDELLTLLTSQSIDTLQLMVHTNEATFAPVTDRNVLAGLVGSVWFSTQGKLHVICVEIHTLRRIR